MEGAVVLPLSTACRVVVFLSMITTGVQIDTCSTDNGWFPWKPSWLAYRDDLYCYGYRCKTKPDKPLYDFDGAISERDDCCLCHSCSTMTEETVDLNVEYTSVTGKSLVLSHQPYDNTTFYQIHHTNDVMTAIPSNLCHRKREADYSYRYENEMDAIKPFWNSIVAIRLDFNFIKELPDINCLERLDTLNLKYNKLTYITNTSISNLTFLRNLDLSENNIKGMDPGVLFSPHLNIFIADLSNNLLSQLDVSNVFFSQPFCKVQYENNRITDIVNKLGFKLDQTRTYGPGMVSLANNLIEVFPDLKTLLGLDSLSSIGQLISWGFDLRGIQLNCNCHLEPIVQLAKDILAHLWLDYLDVRCVTPPELRDRQAIKLDPSELVCKLDVTDGCPRQCKCVDKPSLNTVFVDCSYRGLEKLPDKLPHSEFSKYISLNVSGNRISNITNVTYIKDITELDLSFNHLDQFGADTAEMLENVTLNISNNHRLRQIPQIFQVRNFCKTVMEGNVFDCNCDNLWLQSWVKTKSSNSCKPLFECEVPKKGIKPASEFTEEILECSHDKLYILASIMAACILLIIVIAALVYRWTYEILIIWTRMKQTGLSKHVTSFKYDVIISLNEEDYRLRMWVNNVLLPVLKLYGYRYFVPYMDVPFGSERDQEMSENIANSRTFLLVLSESYLTSPEDCTNGRSWTENEWKYGWHRFLANPDHNLVIVNYDYVSPSAVGHPQIRAFLRVGHVVDFVNFDSRVLVNIRRKIGLPSLRTVHTFQDENNCNERYRPGSAQKSDKLGTNLVGLLNKHSNVIGVIDSPAENRETRPGVDNPCLELFSLQNNAFDYRTGLPWHLPVRPVGRSAVKSRSSKVAPL